MRSLWTRNLVRFSHSYASRPSLAIPYKTGQPMHETRSHYLPEPGFITPGITALEYYDRRMRLAKDLPVRSAVIVAGNKVVHSSGSVFYHFQQDTDFYYLTGWLEPDSVAVIEKVADNKNDDDIVFHMLVPPKNPATELWEGERTGLQGAYDYFNADEVAEVGRLDAYLKGIISRNDHIYFDSKSKGAKSSKFSNFFSLGYHRQSDAIDELLRGKNVKSLKSVLANHRALKSPAEIKVMHKAGQISSRAFNTAMARVGSSEPFMTEKLLAKYLDYAFVRGGCDREAYIPVVASGPNALTIHYTRNDDILYKDETVFVDAGGKLGGYCADISRTWPNSPNGFSDAQKDIYEVVLNANRVCIDQCNENYGMSLHDVHELSVTTLLQGLRSLPGLSEVTRSEVSRELFPHYIGHHLGLDLHDVPSASRFARLRKGNVVTIEPGIYVPFDSKWPKHYQGIGVRVEDDIAVGSTASDILNLTSLCAKEVADVESLVRSGKATTPGVHDEAVEISI
ncbi:hypothetical protein FT663_02794 [Candidozyma haemuli var. vulneris]|uniref:Aminopeptidase P N-terminal domain-containing protein n=1 Tax=Candidozyma haemuli TaxID=45357 RepID=A0A2V1AX42_9ASCO|nr:hypothetical protein CXQ85_005234 [[Candida] haemuloni]KAF3991293.1 hypothetical protein FT663_02794 [[Candida] haemuloni var. vulneris]KAF3991979.1 hypothetical protein FT662_01432 [[Candida] haemuloni var. vulneris]PVH22660.1 hypothetical protein CXQ85_005234 [[Candida] haemuloni]